MGTPHDMDNGYGPDWLFSANAAPFIPQSHHNTNHEPIVKENDTHDGGNPGWFEGPSSGSFDNNNVHPLLGVVPLRFMDDTKKTTPMTSPPATALPTPPSE